MPQNFFVFCEARTGSYSLVSRLNSCSDIICHGEIFKKDRFEIPPRHRRASTYKTLEARNADPIGFIENLRGLNAFKHFGFKLFNQHLNLAPGMVAYLKAPEVRKVILYRDPREVYASILRVRSTGDWMLDKGQAPRSTAEVKVTYTPESFRSFAGYYNKFTVMTHLLAALPNSFVIHHHQINDPEALAALLAVLGSRADAARSSTEYERQYRGELRDGFTNWDAFDARLAAAPLLDGPPPSFTGAAGAEAARAGSRAAPRP